MCRFFPSTQKMHLILNSYIVDLTIIVATAAFILYKYSTRNFGYWKAKGVPYLKPSPFTGNFFDVFALRATIGHTLAKFYNQFKTPYFGIYVLNKPHFVIRSPDLIKTILIKDFNYFTNRTTVSDVNCDSLASKMLFFAKNPEWRLLRSKMTSAFSTGKIKNMLALINGVGDEMTVYLDKHLAKDSLEAKEICAKYSTDIIATCAFGIDAHCFQYEDAQFRVIGRKMFDIDIQTSMRQTAYFLAPGFVKLFKMPFWDSSVSAFMRDVFWKTIDERERTNHKRNDLIDIITQLKNGNNHSDVIKFEGDTVVAQAGQFYAAGFETISSTMAFTLYELCLHPKIQSKVRSEIKSAVSQHGDFTYEALQDMKYLHMVVCEILRKYPVLPFLDRDCIQDYKIPNTDLVIEKGTPVYIPMFGLHYDPEYFPDPETFDPERFSDKNKHKVPSFTYIPFGEGPRNCIGERFGLLVTKMGLARLLSDFEIEKSDDTPAPLKYVTKSFLLASTVGLPMKFKKSASLAA